MYAIYALQNGSVLQNHQWNTFKERKHINISESSRLGLSEKIWANHFALSNGDHSLTH